MDDLKSVTLSSLRGLARKYLGSGYRKLSKKQLISALAQFVPALKKLARLAGIPQPTSEAKEPKAFQPAQVVNFPPRPRPARAAAGSKDTPGTLGVLPQAPTQHAAEPLVEGFFVARVMGEGESRRHHMTEDQAPSARAEGVSVDEEGLGELPMDYASDLVMALARDPHTLFVAWDFSHAARARAMKGLDAPRPILRVYDGDTLVREVEIAIESRSFYLHGLPSGRTYRVEAHFVGSNGRSRRIGSSMHPVSLPQAGLSQDTSVRFMRMPPPPEPTTSAGLPQPMAIAPLPLESEGEVREYLAWRREPLPGSADMAWRPERTFERSARDRPTAPVAPAAPAGAGPTHLDVSVRPLGASEHSGGAGRGPREIVMPIHWTPPPSGRGR